MQFFLFIIVKMPTIVGILTFMGRKHFMLSRVEHEKITTVGPEIKIAQRNAKRYPMPQPEKVQTSLYIVKSAHAEPLLFVELMASEMERRHFYGINRTGSVSFYRYLINAINAKLV